MKIAAVHAIAEIARQEVPAIVSQAYEGENLEFGPNYIIPKPNDPRLLGAVSSAVAKAAIDTGVARKGYPAHYPLNTLDDIFPCEARLKRSYYEGRSKNPKSKYAFWVFLCV